MCILVLLFYAVGFSLAERILMTFGARYYTCVSYSKCNKISSYIWFLYHKIPFVRLKGTFQDTRIFLVNKLNLETKQTYKKFCNNLRAIMNI